MTKETIGTVTVSKWSKELQAWKLYSVAHSYSLSDFTQVLEQKECTIEDANYLYQFTSDCADNIQTYFASYDYCI
jgi:hypothetical protein